MTPPGEPAFAALLEACRRWLGPDLSQPGLEELDWRHAGRLAFFHNLQPLLHRLLEEGGLDDAVIPVEVREEWEASHYRNLLFNLQALELLGQLVREAAEAGAELAVFKGPATMARVYGEPALRIMVDLDLLLRRSDLARVSDIAAGLGFVANGRDHLLHATSTHPESGLGLELHFDIYDFLRRRGDLVERVLEQRVELELEGCVFPAAPPELALVLEVAHLVQHDLRANLRSWLDLAALLYRPAAPLDWPALEEALRRHGLLPELRLAVEIVAELFTLSPEEVPLYRSSGYSRSTRTRLMGGLAAYHRGVERPALQELSFRRGAIAKASYLGRRLLPTGGRWRALAGEDRRSASLAAYWRQAARTAARELGRWRTAGIAGGEESVKAAVYARNQGSGPA